MDYEKKYKEALERAKGMWEQGMMPERIEYIFPELKESEDERIRKWLEETIESMSDNNIIFKDVRRIDVLHWLEKQGEKKSADKVEPKFKVGDWICTSPSGGYLHIKNIEEDGYMCKDILGEEIKVLCEHPNCGFKLWTIQDAKEGDVLEYQGEVFIIKELKKKIIASRTIEYYCCYDGEHFINNSIYSIMDDDLVNIYPATKEQRELLFQKMKEAGYEWDAEKKELKKLMEE